MSARPREGVIVNRRELADLWGVALTTVDAWIRRGCPVTRRGNRKIPWEFDSAAVADWRLKQAALDAAGDTRDVSLDEARKRKMAAEAALAELELAKARGEAVSIEDVGQVWEDISASIRARLLPMGGKLAPRVAPMRKRSEVKAAIDAEVHEALDELSRYAL